MGGLGAQSGPAEFVEPIPELSAEVLQNKFLWPGLPSRERGYAFWENLTAWPDPASLLSSFVSLAERELLAEIVQQNNIISCTASRKYRLLHLAFPGLVVGFFFGILGFAQ